MQLLLKFYFYPRSRLVFLLMNDVQKCLLKLFLVLQAILSKRTKKLDQPCEEHNESSKLFLFLKLYLARRQV